MELRALVAWYVVSATTKIPTFVIPTPASVWRSLIGGFMVQSLLGAIIGELISGQAGLGAVLAILSIIGAVQYVILAVLRRRRLFWTDVTERSVV